MKAQIRVEGISIKIQVADKLIGNKTYGYALFTKVPHAVYEKINDFIQDGLTEVSLSSGSNLKYAACEIEYKEDAEVPHYNLTVFNGENKLKIGLTDLPYDFNVWFDYTKNKREKCPKCGSSYKAIINGGKFCGCSTAKDTCVSCGDEAEGYGHGGDSYCENCFYETFVTCDECGKTDYNEDSTYHNDTTYCSKCADKYLYSCWGCGDTHSSSNEFEFEYDGHSYCDSCFEEKFQTCEKCDDTVPNKDIQEVKIYNSKYGHTSSFCDDCASQLKECKNCGEKFCDHDGDFCCEDCGYDEEKLDEKND